MWGKGWQSPVLAASSNHPADMSKLLTFRPPVRTPAPNPNWTISRPCRLQALSLEAWCHLVNFRFASSIDHHSSSHSPSFFLHFEAIKVHHGWRSVVCLTGAQAIVFLPIDDVHRYIHSSSLKTFSQLLSTPTVRKRCLSPIFGVRWILQL